MRMLHILYLDYALDVRALCCVGFPVVEFGAVFRAVSEPHQSDGLTAFDVVADGLAGPRIQLETVHRGQKPRTFDGTEKEKEACA